MRAGRGERVIQDGIPVKASHLDRGRLLFATELEMSMRLGRYVLRWAFALCVPALVLLVPIEVYSRWPPSIPFMAIIMGMMFLMSFIITYAYFVPNRHVPGIYANGIELVYRVFVPFEEIEGTSRGSPWLGRALILHLKGPRNQCDLSESMYGMDGLDYVEARVRERMEAMKQPPRMNVYPLARKMDDENN